MRARRAGDPLAPYNRKRRFDVTREPRGTQPRARSGRSFVVQKHDATRLHYDFRLELDGVLKSWAVPKGPSLNPGDKRLAMQTEDHPVSYGDFEGVIPEGEYGAGPVIVWDRGTWEPLEDPHRALDKGAIKFALHGEKLDGTFSLVRLKRSEGSGQPWLLIKRSDDSVRRGGGNITERLPRSVISGRTIEEIAARKPATQARVRRRRRPKARVPEVEPQLATLVATAPAGGDWLYEIKFDGYRALAARDGRAARIVTRNGLDWTERFPSVASELRALGVENALLDGEVCYVLEDGRTDFQHLQNALRLAPGSAEQRRVVYFAFDLLFLDGEDLREQPLRERKARLGALLADRQGAVRFSQHLGGDGRAVLAQACQLGLEGVIGKRADRPYRSGRSGEWIKLKCHKRQEFVIVGLTDPRRSRQGFGALMLGLPEQGGLRFVGKVGTGFTDRSLHELTQRLTPLVTDTPPVTNPPRLRNARWVEPKLVCEVSFTEFTRDGILRHPSFEGLREDKPAGQVKLEQPVASPRPAAAASKNAPATGARRPGKNLEAGGIRITHPERIMDRASGTTKGDLARYHEAVSKLLLPYAERRPLALVRCPQGDAQDCFFQKQATAGFSDAIGRLQIEGRDTLHVTAPRGIFELVQFNVVEFHGWGARLPAWDKPDWIVFDFDPDTGLPFARVVEAALEMKELLAKLELVSYVKTTGGKGLHVVAPLRPRLNWARMKRFTRGIAEEVARHKPDEYVVTASKQQRKGKIFVDYLRNAHQATAVLPYSPRARPGATVALPVAWKDLRHLDPREFTVATVPALIKKRRRDPWADFFDQKQDIAERLGAYDGG